MTVTDDFRQARDRLLALSENYDEARRAFVWPRFDEFNFATDWFDALAADPDRGQQPALIIVEQDGSSTRRTFAELAEASRRAATWLHEQGVRRGDHVIIMLGNQVELWELILASIRLGAVMIPTTTLMGPRDLQDRVERGAARWAAVGAAHLAKFDNVAGDYTLIRVGRVGEEAGVGESTGVGEEAAEPDAAHDDDGGRQGGVARSGRAVLDYADSADASPDFEPDARTHADETLLLYFTSGTTSKPKLVEHTHTSYPVGHLSTAYWIGLEPGDVHLNVASPGWAKHAWSNVFAPWIAEATVFIYNYERFDPAALMEQMGREGVTSFCAPPTVWRMLIQSDLTKLGAPPRKVVSAGEPLNAEVIDQVKKAWGVTIRDGFGQTETTVQVANTPGQPVTAGAMGRPLPGYDVVLVDPATGEETDDGELCLRLDPRPVGLMAGYHGDPERTAEAFRGGYYHTGDMARRAADGVITYVGRDDDVFKSSDYRLSPFELESVLIEHPAVAEAAVVPSPDPVRLSVPKAFVVLARGYEASPALAEEILRFAREHLAPFKRIRRLEFSELPKTISGKIRRVELRHGEEARHAGPGAGALQAAGVEYSEADFPGLKD
ncbi:AMP-binding protein [Sinomonas sp. ASV322]|uniref:AMP-binding protein n=1 Tax=Sinomonas sp. ASV322 TaxID=3041920 RepID=UPI0027DB6F77|nr:AMP-binding protein [Sinomonas sp. ASV322]MDQ4502502.1 AMP-binding protein [Sinomonas sp. ASV322]